MRTSLKAVVAITVLVVSLASAGIAAASPSKAEFIRKGDALCTQTKRALVPIQARAQAAKTLPDDAKWQATAELWADQIAIQRRFVVRFRAIGTPSGDRAATDLISRMARGIPLAVNIQRGYANRDTTRLPTFLSNYVNFTLNLNRRVVAYGFRACGR